MKTFKRSPAQFDVWCPEKPKDLIHLDFRPFLMLKECTTGVLLHFQAKPRGMREWGAYDIDRDEYYSRPHNNIEFWGQLTQRLLGLDELRHKTNPTALCYFRGATVVLNEETGAIAIAPREMKDEVESKWKRDE